MFRLSKGDCGKAREENGFLIRILNDKNIYIDRLLIFSMKKLLVVFGVLIFLVGVVSAVECVVPTNGMVITEDTTFCEGEYYLPNGISIGANDVTLDCDRSTLKGNFEGITTYAGNITIKNCRLINYKQGIRLGSENNINILNNYFESNFSGNIYIWGYETGIRIPLSSSPDPNNIMIKDNVFINHTWGGVFMTSKGDSNNISIINNTVDGGTMTGINIIGKNHVIKDNKLMNIGSTAISSINSYPSGLNKSLIKNNLIINSGYGIGPTTNSLIIENSVIDSSTCAIILGTKNTYHHNNFINSGSGHICLFGDPSLNDWDDGSEGNFWDDYIGKDLNNDGIGDTLLPHLSVDNFPLINPFELDIDNDSVSDENDFCPSTTTEQIVDGCSCEQILEFKPGNDESECSDGIIKVFTERRGWARDLF